MENFAKVITDVRENVSKYVPQDLFENEMHARSRKRAKYSSRTIEHDAKEAYDVIITQIKECCKNSHIFLSLTISNLKKFRIHNYIFPENDLNNISTYYAMLKREQLKRELNVI